MIAARPRRAFRPGRARRGAVDYHDLAAAAAEARFAYGEAVTYTASALERLDVAAGAGGDRSPRAAASVSGSASSPVLAHGYSQPEVEEA